MNNELFYDKPRSQGAANALARVQQLVKAKWSPVNELVINDTDFLQSTRSGKLHTGAKEYIGFPYSSSRVMDKMVGLDISIDTFMTAVDNPASIFYTRDLADFDDEAYNCTISNTFLTYGVVCSSLVNYAFNLPIHISTHEWDITPELVEITDRTPNSLELCDSMVTTRPDGRTGGHVRIVTGIARDKNGNVKQVEIAEGWEPHQRCLVLTADEVDSTFLGKTDDEMKYRIFRYTKLDSVPEPMKEVAVKNSDLMLNLGDYSNYRIGEAVEFNINCDADELVIEGTDSKMVVSASKIMPKTILGNTYKIYSVSNLKPDRYTAYCVKNGEKTLPVHFIVLKTPDIKLAKADGSEFKRVALKPVETNGSPLTKASSCLYTEDGKLNNEDVTIALSDGSRLIPARVGVREKDGELYIRTAAMLTDANGNPIKSFRIGDDITLYAFEAEENTPVKVYFSNSQCCVPYHLSWKEEAAITYEQRMITADEINKGQLETKAFSHYNAFTHFMIFCNNEYGKITSESIPFVIK